MRLLRPCCSSAVPKRTERPSSVLWRRGLPCSSTMPLVSRTSLLDAAPPRSVGIALGASTAARRLRNRGGDDKDASRPPRAIRGLVADMVASLASRAVADRARPRASPGVASQLRRAARPLAVDDRGEAKDAGGRSGLRSGREGNSSARRRNFWSRLIGDLDLLCLSCKFRSVGANLWSRGDGDCNMACRLETSPRRGSESDCIELRLGGGCFG